MGRSLLEWLHIDSLEEHFAEHFAELKDHFDEMDRDRSMRDGWHEVARAFDLDMAPEPGEPSLGFLRRLRAHLKEKAPKADRELSPFALLLHLVLAFLEGPLKIVASDTMTKTAQALVLHKVRNNRKLETDDVAALDKGIENLHGSGLYPLGYRFIYRHFDELAQGMEIEPPDELPTYPPTEDLIALCADIDRLFAEIAGVHALLDRALASPQVLDDPRFQKDLERELTTNPAYLDYNRKTTELIKAVIGSAATHFLIEALKSIPEVEAYLRRAMAEFGGGPPNEGGLYIKILKESPPYLRTMVYVAEANDEDHLITGTRVPFPVETSRSVSAWVDKTITRLFGGEAPAHPFYSSKRASIEAEDPLDVEAEYEREKGGNP